MEGSMLVLLHVRTMLKTPSRAPLLQPRCREKMDAGSKIWCPGGRTPEKVSQQAVRREWFAQRDFS
jgi:hypothetical protein